MQSKTLQEETIVKYFRGVGQVLFWSIQFDNAYPLNKSKYTAVKCTANKHVKLDYILVRSIVFICLSTLLSNPFWHLSINRVTCSRYEETNLKGNQLVN